MVELAAAGAEADSQVAIVKINESKEAQTRLNVRCRMEIFLTELALVVYRINFVNWA